MLYVSKRWNFSDFLVFESKIASILRLQRALRFVQVTEKFLAFVHDSRKNLAFSLLQFYNAAKAAKKPVLKQVEHCELNNFTNMVAKIDIHTLKI